MVLENSTPTVKTNSESTVEQKRARIKKEASKYVVEPGTSPLLHISELLNKEFPKRVWLVDRLVAANAVTIFSAPPDSLKTRTLLHLAVAVAKGEPLFGEFPTQQSGVLIVDQESGEQLLKMQLRQLGATDDLPIHYRSYQNFKLNDENIEVLRYDCKMYGLNVVIFDSLIQIHNANENEATEMAPVMEYLRKLAAHDITVLVIAHDRKPGINGRRGNTELRGSSAILAAVDAHISLFSKKNRLTIQPTKLRYGLPLEPFELLVTGDENSCNFEFLGQTKRGDSTALKAAIINTLRELGKLCQQDLLSALNESGTKVGETKLRDSLNDMLDDGELEPAKGAGNTKFYSLPPTT